MHVIAGFESQIAARGGALAIADAARGRGLTVSGAAVARRDTERAIHVDPVPGFEMPAHVLQVLDGIFPDRPGPASLHVGETGLVVSFADGSDVATLAKEAQLESHGALWILTA